MTTIRDMSQWLELEQQKQLQSLRTVAFASAAHEFRNPLNSLILSLQLLAPFIVDELALKYLTVAMNCSKLMLFLVNDILDFSQHEEKKMILNMTEVVNLAQIIGECIDVLKFKAEQKKLELRSKF